MGAYSLWNKHLYGAVTLYRSAHIGSSQPPSSTDSDTIRDVAPYWRLAVEKKWDSHSLEVGTYGLYASVFPGGAATPPAPTKITRLA